MKRTIEQKLKIIDSTPYMFNCDVMKRDFIWLVESLKNQLEVNKKLQMSDASKEESSINYYNEMKRLEDELKYFKGYEHKKYFNTEDGDVNIK